MTDISGTDSLTLSELDIGLSAGDVLCAFDDIEDGSAIEFSYRSGSDLYDIFIQRVNKEVYGFLNVCPHTGTPLNMEQGKFMEKSGKYLMCHTHGALFQLPDGLCVGGPCVGEKLQAVNITVENNNIIVL